MKELDIVIPAGELSPQLFGVFGLAEIALGQGRADQIGLRQIFQMIHIHQRADDVLTLGPDSDPRLIDGGRGRDDGGELLGGLRLVGERGGIPRFHAVRHFRFHMRERLQLVARDRRRHRGLRACENAGAGFRGSLIERDIDRELARQFASPFHDAARHVGDQHVFGRDRARQAVSVETRSYQNPLALRHADAGMAPQIEHPVPRQHAARHSKVFADIVSDHTASRIDPAVVSDRERASALSPRKAAAEKA